jgi:glutaredoxin
MFTSHTVPEIQMDYNCVLNPWYNNSWCSIQDQGIGFTLEGWQNYSGQDIHSINLNPLVVDNSPGSGHPDADYYLTENSLCIDAGDPSYPVPPWGGTRIDIGAYEFAQQNFEEKYYKNRKQKILSTILTDLKLLKSASFKYQIFDLSGRKIRNLKIRKGKYFILLNGTTNKKRGVPVIFFDIK